MTTNAQLLSFQTTSLVTFLLIPQSSRYHYWVSTEALLNALLECLFVYVGGMPMEQWTTADVILVKSNTSNTPPSFNIRYNIYTHDTAYL